MTDTTLVKVRCNVCGRLICRVFQYRDELAYRITVGGGGITFDHRVVFCPEHGWPDLGHPALLRKASDARASGKTATHRAHCVRRVPIA